MGRLGNGPTDRLSYEGIKTSKSHRLAESSSSYTTKANSSRLPKVSHWRSKSSSKNTCPPKHTMDLEDMNGIYDISESNETRKKNSWKKLGFHILHRVKVLWTMIRKGDVRPADMIFKEPITTCSTCLASVRHLEPSNVQICLSLPVSAGSPFFCRIYRWIFVSVEHWMRRKLALATQQCKAMV